MSNKSEVYLPLISDEVDLDSGCRHEPTQERNISRRPKFTTMHYMLLLATIFLQAIGLLLLFLAYRRSTEAYRQTTLAYNRLQQTCQYPDGETHLKLYTPAHDILEDQIKVFDEGLAQKTIYQQYTDEGDRAWEDLYNYDLVKISKSEAALLPNRTWPIKDAPGYYFASLDVFHQLHCVNKVRQALRRDRYDHILERPEKEFDPDHLSHCVDSLRQYVMCHSDPSVVVWQWDPQGLVVRPQFGYPHKCKNFDKVREWAKERLFEGKIDTKTYIEDDIPPPAIIY